MRLPSATFSSLISCVFPILTTRNPLSTNKLRSFQREGDRISVTANITSTVSIKTPTEAVNSELSFDGRMKLLQKSFPSLPKQMEAQDKLMKAEKSGHSYADYEYDVVNSLSPKSPIALNADNSLLLCAAWSKHVSLFDILSDDEHVDAPDGLSNYALELMKPESPYNEAVISEIDTRMFFPRMPILWWKISDELCRDIYFKRVSISTVFNLVPLCQQFRSRLHIKKNLQHVAYPLFHDKPQISHQGFDCSL